MPARAAIQTPSASKVPPLIIRLDIGHDEVNIYIEKIYFNKDTNELWIITEDRPDKSAIIGKGGWVVGKLREKLNLESIHVESYGDFLNKEYNPKDSYMGGSTMTIYYDYYPNTDKSLDRIVIRDLYADGFIDTDSLNAMVSSSGMVEKHTTSLGDDMIEFFGIEKM